MKYSLLSILVGSLLLAGCGGGDDKKPQPNPSDNNSSSNNTGGNNNSGGNEQLDLNIPSELTMNSTVSPRLKDLTTDWNKKVTEIDETKLSFAGNPKLVSGDVFVVKEAAYKVVNVTGDTVGNTIVTVTQPALDEIYAKIEVSGKMDALEFIPNPELFDDTPQARAATNAREDKITVNAKEDGFLTFEYEMKKKFSPNLHGIGSLKIGAKSDFTKGWEIISNTGQGTFDIYLSPSVMLSLQKTLETGKKYDDGICSSKLGLRKGGRIYLGSIPLGKAAAALPGGQIITAATNINIPVCLPVNVSSDMKYDLLELSGKLQTKIVVGNKTSPQITNQNNLKIESPPISATLSEGTLEGKKKYSVTVQGEAGLEVGLEIEDKIGKIANVGANIAVLVKPELKGTFGVGLVSKKLSALEAEPEACLELKVKADLQSKVFASSWGNAPLTGVALFPLKEISKKYGQCHDENNDVSEDVSLSAATCSFTTNEEHVTHLPDGGESTYPASDFYTYDISGSLVLNQVIENISTLKLYRYPVGYSVTPIVIGADGKNCIGQNWTGDINNYSEIPTVLQEQPLPPLNTQWRIKGSLGNPYSIGAYDCKSPSIFQGLRIDYHGGDKPTGGKDNITVNIPCPKKSEF